MGTSAATERAYAHLKDGILARQYAGGRLLTEGEIAEAVGVSRTPVREALLRLAGEGLLRLYPKRGALILPVSPAEVHDVLEARELVEVHSARRLAAAGHPGQLVNRLRGELAAMAACELAGDPAGFARRDRAFHSAFVAAAGNEILAGLYDRLRDRQLRMGTATMADDPRRMAVARAEHEEIMAAIESADGSRLQRAVRTHLRTVATAAAGSR